jgi:L-ascorbate metabolism protein UlaG (beta-lactamase superfamily)
MRLHVLAITIGLAAALAPASYAQSVMPACGERTMVSTGGAFPARPETLAVRWTGYSNFELAYRNEILLLDAYFDRGAIYAPLGFTASAVTRANAILIGHGHHDHMADAASIALRTGAVVVGAPVTTEKLTAQKVPAAQVRTVTGKGGEELRLGRFTVQPILARHGDPPAEIRVAFAEALKRTTPALTAEQNAEQRAIRERGTNDPRVAAEGTIAYLITLDNGFRLAYRDSGGVITDFERQAMAKAGRVDLALMATAASVLPTLTAQQAVEYAKIYRPAVFMPAHHDAPVNDLWRATEPLFQAIREQNPSIVTISHVYREPACFDTTRQKH